MFTEFHQHDLLSVESAVTARIKQKQKETIPPKCRGISDCDPRGAGPPDQAALVLFHPPSPPPLFMK